MKNKLDILEEHLQAWTKRHPCCWWLLQKLADFFNVSIDYILGREEKPSSSSQPDTPLTIPEKYRDVLIACNEGADDLTQEDIDAIVRFIEFTKNSKKK